MKMCKSIDISSLVSENRGVNVLCSSLDITGYKWSKTIINLTKPLYIESHTTECITVRLTNLSFVGSLNSFIQIGGRGNEVCVIFKNCTFTSFSQVAEVFRLIGICDVYFKNCTFSDNQCSLFSLYDKAYAHFQNSNVVLAKEKYIFLLEDSSTVSLNKSIFTTDNIKEENKYLPYLGLYLNSNSKAIIKGCKCSNFTFFIYAQGYSYADISSSYFYNNSVPLYFVDMSLLNLQNSVISSSTRSGIETEGYPSLHIINSEINNSKEDGIFYKDSPNIFIKGSKIVNINGVGINAHCDDYVKGKCVLIIDDCEIEDCKSVGIVLNKESKLDIRNSIIKGCSKVNILSIYSKNIIIHNCYFGNNNEDSMFYHIIAHKGSTDIKIDQSYFIASKTKPVCVFHIGDNVYLQAFDCMFNCTKYIASITEQGKLYIKNPMKYGFRDFNTVQDTTSWVKIEDKFGKLL